MGRMKVFGYKYIYYIHPELRISDCRYGTGEGAEPLWREQRGSNGRATSQPISGQRCCLITFLIASSSADLMNAFIDHTKTFVNFSAEISPFSKRLKFLVIDKTAATEGCWERCCWDRGEFFSHLILLLFPHLSCIFSHFSAHFFLSLSSQILIHTFTIWQRD